VSEAQAFTDTIDCKFRSITDLTGIEAFTALTVLICRSNQLTSLDVTQNTALIELNCGANQLTSLDVTQNTALTFLSCRSNQLTSLDVTQNTALNFLYCYSNPLTSLDVTQNTALIDLSCDDNQLTSLDVTQNTALMWLRCYANQLTTLDVTQNTALVMLYCYDNQLTTLDMTPNTALTQLWCQNNQLTTLNVANGNNTNISDFFFDATNNPSLSCIQVDDSTYSATNWTDIDTQYYFSENCGVLSIDKTARPTLDVYPNPAYNQLSINTDLRIQEVQLMDMQGRLVKTIRNQATIPVADLQQGVYFLTIFTEQATYRSTFVKQ